MRPDLAPVLVLVPVVLTSVAAYLLGPRRTGSRPGTFGIALRRTLECIGITVVFFVLNLAVGAAVVFSVRTLTRYFVAVYVMTDIILVPLSLFQGLVFWWWHVLSAPVER